MKWESLIHNSGFAVILTSLITIATCIITYFQGIRQVKINQFEEIYECLQKLSKEKTKILEHCSRLMEQMAQKIPDEMVKIISLEDAERYRKLYHEFNRFLMEYSLYIESIQSFYHFLYKDKPNIPSTKIECWQILKVYEKLTEINYQEAQECKINYIQIVTLIQFIKVNSGFFEKIRIYRYFINNKVFGNRAESMINAFF